MDGGCLGVGASAKVDRNLQNVQLELQVLDERCADEQIHVQLKYRPLGNSSRV